MREIFFHHFVNGFFTFNMLPLVLLFSCRLKKRRLFWARVISGGLFCISFAGFFGHGILTYTLQFLGIVLFCFFICNLSFLHALYCSACAYAAQHMAYCFYQIVFRPEKGMPIYSFSYLMCQLFIAGLAYWFVVRRLPEDGEFNLDVRFSLISLGIILFLVLGLSIIADGLFNDSRDPLYYVCMMYDGLCCMFVMWEQADYKEKLKRQREQDLEIQLQLKQKELYRLRRDDIERINLLCHDMKKHLESLKLFADEEERQAYYDKVSRTIESYDAQFETGNRVLDILLAQKKLLCMKNKIELTCVANGKKLDFIHVVDLYTIMGNILDNAIESALLVLDEDKRFISVSIWSKGHLLLMQIENYYENPNLEFAKGLPVTMKKEGEGHGYGLKSVKKTVEKYNGVMNVSVNDHLFKVTMIIPVSDDDKK